MKRVLRKDATHLEIGAHLPPALTVEPGERFVLETIDNWFDALGNGAKPDVTVEPIKALQVIRLNPVAGPVYINGVEPGDTLAITIHDIDIRDWGWTGTMKGRGITGALSYFSDIDDNFATVVRHEKGPSGTWRDGRAVMNVGREVSWPLLPFIGMIATAPERGIENTVTTQGAWGGNLDIRDVTSGNTIFLNAAHAGGLLYMGDVHGSQADAEFMGMANETASDITLSVKIIKNHRIPGVMRIEKEHTIIQVDSGRNAGDRQSAINNCFLNMTRWLVDEYGMDKREAVMHLTANSQVRIHVYQCTPGGFCCGVEFPKANL